jgi:hypothetical protein
MTLSASEVLQIAESTGFNPGMIEKVLHLIDLLNALNAHPYLKGKWVLKGGTALNLFIFKLPRLSVDIDLNYIGAPGRDEMLEERPKIEQAMHAVFSRGGFTVKRAPKEHAGGKWLLNYQSYTGQSGNIEVDLNFMFRLPLWNVTKLQSNRVGNRQAMTIPVLDPHELAAGKLAALVARSQARDLFDSFHILNSLNLDDDLLRIGFVVYGGMNRKDWRTVTIDSVSFDMKDVANRLLPIIHANTIEDTTLAKDYGTRLVEECRRSMTRILPFTEAEAEFLDLLLDKGEIAPFLLTKDPKLQQRIKQQPLLEWKALHVRRHKC